MTYRLFVLVLALHFVSYSCGSSDDDDDDGLSCEEGFTQEEIDDNYQIVEDYDQSIHEMVVCGAITIKLTKAINTFIVELLLGIADETVPEGMEYDTNGDYLLNVGGDEVAMAVRFINGEESSLGAAGTPIVPNLFEKDNYLIGADIKPSLQEIEISFDETGPLVELLGFGPSPESPLVIPLSLGGVLERANGVENIEVASDILVNDQENNSLVTYSVKVANGTTLDQVVLGTFEYEVLDAEVERSDLNQVITNTLWELNFSNAGSSSGALTGTVAFTSTGGHFPFQGIMIWEDEPFGEETLTCIE